MPKLPQLILQLMGMLCALPRFACTRFYKLFISWRSRLVGGGINHAGFVVCQAKAAMQAAASGSRDGGGVRLVAIRLASTLCFQHRAFNAVRFA
jgi:hypothetical protein